MEGTNFVARSPAAELVGRHPELAALEEALAQVEAGAAGWVELSGEAGIGKTRLLGELQRRADERGWLVLSGRAGEFERGVPFAPVLEALDDYLGALDLDRLEDELGTEAVGQLAAVFPALAALAGRGAGKRQIERYRFHYALRRLLERLADSKPVLLALDDVHWADPASLELVSHLLRRPPHGRVLVALALRSHETPNELAAAVERTSLPLTRVRLNALARVEADQLLGEELDAATKQALYGESGGNPFYLEQLARARRREKGSPARLAEVLPVVPAGVAASLAAELAALPPPARALAEAAAVAGDSFEPEIVAEIADVCEPDALATLDELLARDLVRATDTPRRFRFRHPIVWRAVYESSKVGWRIEAHARAAAALHARGRRPLLLAHHIDRSARRGDAEAVTMLADAGHAATALAPASAARWFEAALRLLPEEAAPSARIGLLLPLAITRAATGRFDDSLAAVEEALRLLPPELASMRVQLVAARAGIDHLLGRYDSARVRLEAELAESASVGWSDEAALKLELAGNRLFASDFEAALRWAAEALQAGRTHGDDAVAAAAAAQLSFAECSLGRMDRADAFREEASSLLQRLDAAGGVVRLDALVMLGWSEYFLESFDDARDRFQRAMATARSTGQMYMFVPSSLGLAYAHATLGSLREADALADAAVETARLGADTRGLSWALFERCWIALLAGDLETALRCGEESVTIARDLDESFLSAGAALPLAAALLESGDQERCLDLMLGSVGGTELRWVMRGIKCLCYELLTRAELDRGHLDEAGRWADRADAAADGLRAGMATGRARRARALVLLASGSAAAAATQALSAAADADGVRARIEAGRSRTLAGRALAAAGESERALATLGAAEAELAECGARRYRDEAARELRRLGHRAPSRPRRGSEAGEGIHSLSAREVQIADLVATGKTNKAVATELYLSTKTIESHLSRIFTKLGVSSRAAMASAVERSRAEENVGAGDRATSQTGGAAPPSAPSI